MSPDDASRTTRLVPSTIWRRRGESASPNDGPPAVELVDAAGRRLKLVAGRGVVVGLLATDPNLPASYCETLVFDAADLGAQVAPLTELVAVAEAHRRVEASGGFGDLVVPVPNIPGVTLVVPIVSVAAAVAAARANGLGPIAEAIEEAARRG